MKKQRDSRMSERSGCRAAAGGANVPTTVLFGRRWPSHARRSIERLARRLATHLGHDVEACDLDAADEPLRLVARRAAARGAMHLVLLPDGHHVFLTEDEACLAAMERFIFDLPSHQPRA